MTSNGPSGTFGHQAQWQESVLRYSQSCQIQQAESPSVRARQFSPNVAHQPTRTHCWRFTLGATLEGGLDSDPNRRRLKSGRGCIRISQQAADRGPTRPSRRPGQCADATSHSWSRVGPAVYRNNNTGHSATQPHISTHNMLCLYAIYS